MRIIFSCLRLNILGLLIFFSLTWIQTPCAQAVVELNLTSITDPNIIQAIERLDDEINATRTAFLIRYDELWPLLQKVGGKLSDFADLIKSIGTHPATEVIAVTIGVGVSAVLVFQVGKCVWRVGREIYGRCYSSPDLPVKDADFDGDDEAPDGGTVAIQ